jgi:glycosyltransferase involved in cell wall biosynthesis
LRLGRDGDYVFGGVPAMIDSLPPPLSIGFYSPGWPLASFQNGIVTSVTTLASTLRGMGHKVSILAADSAEETPDESIYSIRQVLAARSIAQRAVDGLFYRIAPRSASRYANRHRLLTMVRRAIAEQGLQLIEIEESFGMARWIREATATPTCVRLHGPWFLNGPALGVPDNGEFRERVREEGWAIRVADAVSAPSRNVLDQVREFYGLVLPEAEVIPAPTSPVPVTERWRLENADAKRLVFVGRFDRHKGGDLIIEAFRRVVEAVPEARLCFKGPDRGCITSSGRKWNLVDFVRDRIPGALETGRVEWLGNQPFPFSALAQLRRQAMVNVVCSRYENFPLTVVEAMALGCPIVAASVGGIPEILQDGVNGLLHRSDDAADLAAKIVYLLKNPVRAAELGRQAASDCERQFYPDVIAGRLLEFYRQVIGKPERSR